MNNFRRLSSLFRGGGRNQNFLRMFRGNRNNKGFIMLSLVGVSLLGILGNRNIQLRQQVQNSFKNVRNTVQNAVKNTRNPIQDNLNLANVEFGKEIKPDTTNTVNQKNQ
jgi:cytoskeletal protein RodZ